MATSMSAPAKQQRQLLLSSELQQQQQDGGIGNNISGTRLRAAFGNMAQHLQQLALSERPRRQRLPAAPSDVLERYNSISALRTNATAAAVSA